MNHAERFFAKVAPDGSKSDLDAAREQAVNLYRATLPSVRS